MAGERHVQEWIIPVDGRSHPAGGHPVQVACLGDAYEHVWMWTITSSDVMTPHKYQIFETDRLIPKGATYVDTAFALNGTMVWHVFDVTNIVHEPTELGDFLGGYLCTCGESWTERHAEENRPWSPPTGPGSCPVAHKHSKACEGETFEEPKRKQAPKIGTRKRGY